MSETNDQRPPFPGEYRPSGQVPTYAQAGQDVPGQADARPRAYQEADAVATEQPYAQAQPAQQAEAQATQAYAQAQPTQQVPASAQPTQAAWPTQQPAQASAGQATSWYEAARQRADVRENAESNSVYGAAPAYAREDIYGSQASSQPTQSYAQAQPTEHYAQAQPTQSYAQAQPTQRTERPQQPTQQYAAASNVPPVPPTTGNGSSAPEAKEPKKRHGKGMSAGLKTFLLALLGGVIGAGALVGVLMLTGVLGTTTYTSSGQSITIDPADEDTTLATAVAAKATSSVVSLTVTTSSSGSIGSGVILDTNGNIITNYHVIEGAQSISVSLADGSSYDATVVGYDESSDLAVVKIDASDTTLTPIEVGDSSSLQVGDWVMSIGSPFGLEQSVSTGIVSATLRSTMLQSSSGNTIYTNLIQTDATINPGNSGGALVDSAGKLIGINSLIESYSGSSSGVGFAIPSNYAVSVATKIINGETVTHAYLGGSFATVTASNARSANLSVNQGAYVSSVTEGGPAAEAGIQAGDVITEIDGEAITSSSAVVLAVRSHEVGDVVEVKFVRGSQEMSVSVTLGEDTALQEEQSQDSSESLLEQYLKQYGYGNGNSSDNSGDSYGYGYGYGYGNNGLGGTSDTESGSGSSSSAAAA